MGQLEISAEGTTVARPAAAWALVADANMYAQWGPWNDGGYDPPSPGPARPDMVQWFTYGRRTRSVERILEVQPMERIVYTVQKGVPVKHYRAEIMLTPDATGGTAIRWRATFDRTLAGRAVHRKLQSVYDEVMTALIAALDHADADPSVPGA